MQEGQKSEIVILLRLRVYLRSFENRPREHRSNEIVRLPGIPARDVPKRRRSPQDIAQVTRIAKAVIATSENDHAEVTQESDEIVLHPARAQSQAALVAGVVPRLAVAVAPEALKELSVLKDGTGKMTGDAWNFNRKRR